MMSRTTASVTMMLLMCICSARADWPMAGGNPQRTSWTAHEVRGDLRPQWVRRFEAYIPQKVQLVAADGMLLVSTVRGLHALDAATGQDRWVYPTSEPLGHSPTIAGGRVYVGGFDRRLHAIELATGKGLWTFAAGAGFATSPLVVDGIVYAGCRDGFLYAVSAVDGRQVWRFQTGGPVLFSAAYADGVIYFASNDSHAYAVDAKAGALVWKSEKLPGAGFHSYWPVIARDKVILSGSENYRCDRQLGGTNFPQFLRSELFPDGDMKQYRSVMVGAQVKPAPDWAHGYPALDLSRSDHGTVPVTRHFQDKPWRRTVFVLDRRTGKEVTYDFHGDGKPTYAPLMFFGTQAGNRYPPAVGRNGMVYISAGYMHSGSGIPRGGVMAWNLDTPLAAPLNNFAADEPMGYAIGGDVLYSSLCMFRDARGQDLRNPNGVWKYWSEGRPTLADRVPGILDGYAHAVSPDPRPQPVAGASGLRRWECAPSVSFGGPNGVYGAGGDQNPPLPYDGRVFAHAYNCVIAFAPQGGYQQMLPPVKVVPAASAATLPEDALKQRLAAEVGKILQAGQLRPGYHSAGFFDQAAQRGGDLLSDYFSYPGDTALVLLRALPHLPAELHAPVRAYVQQWFAAHPPHRIAHIGWNTGTAREVFIIPPETQAIMDQWKAQTSSVNSFAGWSFPPHANYVLWKYAQAFGSAAELLAQVRPPARMPDDQYLLMHPHVLNAHIAGLIGTVELSRLAGREPAPEAGGELQRLLKLRVEGFSKDMPLREQIPASGLFGQYQLALAVARNFMYLVPELAGHLRQHALPQVEQALEEYQRIAPMWFVAKAEEGFGEMGLSHLWDLHSLFQAKAMILRQDRAELTRWIDVPAFAVGDLFHIDNLCAALEAGGR
jgi:hypothetical protein